MNFEQSLFWAYMRYDRDIRGDTPRDLPTIVSVQRRRRTIVIEKVEFSANRTFTFCSIVFYAQSIVGVFPVNRECNAEIIA